jgi:hypothetical protein
MIDIVRVHGYAYPYGVSLRAQFWLGYPNKPKIRENALSWENKRKRRI